MAAKDALYDFSGAGIDDYVFDTRLVEIKGFQGIAEILIMHLDFQLLAELEGVSGVVLFNQMVNLLRNFRYGRHSYNSCNP